MREITVSNCEKAFLLKAILEGKRIDGRKDNDYRKLKILFGNSYGCCVVSLGETRVMAQTSYEVQVPKSTRPTEGLLFVNVDLSAMAAQHIESGRPSEAGVQLNRLLEKCLKESRCVDLESLCIVAEEKVWAVRIDVTVLNHDGGLVDCASLAALASLAHSRHPDVTLSGEEVTIHTIAERDPLPITLHHHPICVSYAIFDKGAKAVVDPTASEEEAAQTNLVVGMNAYRELCGLHLDGAGLPSNTEKDIVLQCVNRAGIRAAEVINILRQTLADDEKARQEKVKTGFSEFVRLHKVSSLAEERIPVRFNNQAVQEEVRKLMKHKYKNKRKTWDEDGNEREEVDESDGEEIVNLGNNTAGLVDQKSKNPRRIHLNLGQMEQDSIVIDSDDNETEDDDQSNIVEVPDYDMEKEQPDQMQQSDSDEDIEDVIKSVREVLKKETSVKLGGEARGKTKEGDRPKITSEEELSNASDEVEVVRELTYEDKMKLAEKIVLDDSEEEETVVLPGSEKAQPSEMPTQVTEKTGDPKKKKKKKSKNKNKSQEKARTWYPKEQW